MIQNPILRGFNPDPSIVRVGDDYYIATSTFEWFPGVQIHHSKDLKNWRLLTRPLDRTSLLDMKGIPDSGGIWAPCLTYFDGLFWLCFTVVNTLNGTTKGTPNYLTTASDIMGPWSEPIYLNASGFDPSLFHDSDGRKWLNNMIWDHRPERTSFYGIQLQEYDPELKQLIGEPKLIFKGTPLGCTEGSHIYKRNGFYYLLTAEGGTSFEHAVTLARSKNIDGPYEVHPANPVLTSRDKPHLKLQKAGHADLVETQNGEWYMVHLCSRPLPKNNRCILGRETAIQKVEWRDDGWLYLANGTNDPEELVEAPTLPEHPFAALPARDDFEDQTLALQYQMQRTPLDDSMCSLTERPGFLRLKGGGPIESRYEQVIVARRQQAFRYTATTLLEFKPETFQQMAGLICYYHTTLFHYCCMSIDEELGPCLYLQSADDGKVTFPLGTSVIPLNGNTRVYLRAKMNYHELAFFYSLDGETWNPVGDTLDSSILSDDYGTGMGFTGAFVGLACQDLSGRRKPADFDFFEYVEEADR
ncbi:MAG: glycoside hydrolase family 43 protein [Pontiellaceae bacterium]|nr:glycoside hydrolase family 43 protein [Pontiellaceae bacterium]